MFAAHAVRTVSAPVFTNVRLSSVYIHSKLYMLVFIFFFQIKDHEVYHVLCHFYAPIKIVCVYRLDKCVSTERLEALCAVSLGDVQQRQDSHCVILCSITWQ